MKLISSGKLLTPDHAKISTFSIVDQAFLHCVISQTQPSGTALETKSNHSIATYGDMDIEEGIVGESYRPDPSSLRGFDRLLQHDREMSIDQVAAIRATFRPSVDEMAESVEREEGESDMTYRLRVEDIWMQAQPPNSEFGLYVCIFVCAHNVLDILGMIVDSYEY